MDKSFGLRVFFLLGVVSGCERTPSIVITSLNLEGLLGSCLLIPCNFRFQVEKNFTRLKSGAVWIKTQSQFITENSAFVIFNSSRTSSNKVMEIIGDLQKNNCTTEFKNLKTEYKDKYFFRVEDGTFRSTASCHPIEITVRDSAWSPSIEVSGNQTESELVTITCSAVAPCLHAPPKLTWDLHQGTPQRLVQNPDGTFNTSITYGLTLTSVHDGYNLTCSAAYEVNGKILPRNIAKTTITLNVARTESGKTSAVTTWLPAVCAIIVIALIGGIVFIWYSQFRRPNLQPAQVQVIEEQASNGDGIHYGDIVFGQRRSKPVIHTEEETVYSLVEVSKNKNRATEMMDIYAQVMK